MFIQPVLEEIKIKIENPSTRFLFMFFGVVPGSLILFATGVRDFSVLQQPRLAWSFLAIALLLLTSLALGCGLFRQKETKPSLLSLLVIANRRK